MTDQFSLFDNEEFKFKPKEKKQPSEEKPIQKQEPEQRSKTPPTCCGKEMVYVCQCVGFRSFWCPLCGNVYDVFDCCGYVHSIDPEYVKYAAPAICDECGINRLFYYSKKPNGLGEGNMREASLGMARRKLRLEKEKTQR